MKREKKRERNRGRRRERRIESRRERRGERREKGRERRKEKRKRGRFSSCPSNDSYTLLTRSVSQSMGQSISLCQSVNKRVSPSAMHVFTFSVLVGMPVGRSVGGQSICFFFVFFFDLSYFWSVTQCINRESFSCFNRPNNAVPLWIPSASLQIKGKQTIGTGYPL